MARKPGYVTATIPPELDNALRNYLFHTRQTISGFVSALIEEALAEAEREHGGPFPQRESELPRGRPLIA